jgi:hypothetical protein
MAISSIEEIKKRKKERQEELILKSGLTVLVGKPDTSKLLDGDVLDNKLLNKLFKKEEKEINEDKLGKELLSNIDNIKSFHQLMLAYAKITLVQPKWEEVEEYLSDIDKAEIGTWGFQKTNEEQVGVERFQKPNNDK